MKDRLTIQEENIHFKIKNVFKRMFQYKIAGITIDALLRYTISAPFIYSMFIPAIILDMFVEIYQNVCFRLYKIPLVKRKDYFTFERTRLPYLNPIEKANCFYCNYFNGLIAYVREIAGRTELYWCPLQNKQFHSQAHEHYEKFAPYGDAEEFGKKKGHGEKKFQEIT